MSEAPVITSLVTNAPGVVTIAWAHSGNGGPLSFRIERDNPDVTFGYFMNNLDSYTNMGLQADTAYRYRVCVLFPDGTIDCSDWKSVRTMPPEQQGGDLPPPTVTAQQVTPTSINVRWSCEKKYGHVHILWRAKSESLNRPQIRVNQAGRLDGSRLFTGLTPNTAYLFGMQGCNTTLLGSSCGRWSTPVELRTSAPPPPPTSRTAPIYGVTRQGELRWHRHEGDSNGSPSWAANDGKGVGVGWDVLHAFSAEDGVVYAVARNGDLLWNRHDGRMDGTFRWALREGRRVGSGWHTAAHVFAGPAGTIYAVYNSGHVRWNRHEGRVDGTFRWALAEGKDVGNATTKQAFWRAARIFAGGGGDGVLYAVMDDGELLWFQHLGWSSGTAEWNPRSGEVVGAGWQVTNAFGLRDTSYIYAVTPDGRLLWNRHDGWHDGTFRWASAESKTIRTGWDVRLAFSG